MEKTEDLAAVFSAVDQRLHLWESAIRQGSGLPVLPELVAEAIVLLQRLLTGYMVAGGRHSLPADSTDILDLFKVFVKGDPSWNAIRDNCRELVYYRNCINMGQGEALPAAPDRMTVRTARHVYLYMKTRCIREGRLDD